MILLGLHFFLEGAPALLEPDYLHTITRAIDILKELDQFVQVHMLSHALHEVLHSDHVESGESLVVLFLFLLATKHSLFDPIKLFNSVQPEVFLLELTPPDLITNLDNILDQRIEFQYVRVSIASG